MKNKPNIILITIDALRADRLGFMGYEKNISPNIDKLVQESAVFTNAFATGPGTPYSFPSILTSTYPLDYMGPRQIGKPRVMISQVLKEQGYSTAAFHSSAYLSSFFGYDQGWDFFEELFNPPKNIIFSPEKGIISKRKGVAFSFRQSLINAFIKITFNSIPIFFFWTLYLKYKIKASKKVSKSDKSAISPASFDKTIRDCIFSMKIQQAPFFLWVHYMDVHRYNDFPEEKNVSFLDFLAIVLPVFASDYYASSNFIFKKFARKHLKYSINLYDQAIEKLDVKIKKLLEFLKKNDLYNNSIICLTADHGEEFLEHEGTDHITDKLYNELLKVPLLIKIPGKSPQKITKKVSLIDLPSTLCELSGVNVPGAFKGKNLFNYDREIIFHQSGWAGEDKIEKWVEVEKFTECRAACQSENWKYIINHGNEKEELYDLKKDPGERANLAFKNEKTLFEMRERVKEFEKTNPPLALLKKGEKVF